MKLIFIYGPPAAGKLTVAEALAALTGFKVFHNHLTVDLALAFFPFGTPAFGRYVHRLRMEAFETAARESVDGVIFTFVYALGSDDEFVREVIQTVEYAGGEVCFVQLTCSKEQLDLRVVADSRRRFHKLGDAAALKKLYDDYELFATVPFVSSQSLDNSNLPPDEAARLIAALYHLPRMNSGL